MNNAFTFRWCLILCVAAMAGQGEMSGAGWPTYRHDDQRSGITSEQVQLPLSSQWSFQPPQPPRRAWPRPAREEPWRRKGTSLTDLLDFDHCFRIVSGEGRVFFGSSADHKIYCLDALTGRARWEFFTEGPVRMAPTLSGGRVYAGSDDGFVYCLEAATGKQLWRQRVGPRPDRLPGNEQLISRWPIRSGIVVREGKAYCAAGLFPEGEGVYLCALDALTGMELWKSPIQQVAQGYLLASGSRLYVPSGKLQLYSYQREDGKVVGRSGESRGTFALISDDLVFSGPNQWKGSFEAVKADASRERIGSFAGNQLIVTPTMVYLSGDDSLRSVCRLELMRLHLERQQAELIKKLGPDPARNPGAAKLQSELEVNGKELAALADRIRGIPTWEVASDYSESMVLAGDTLLLGGDGEVAAFSSLSGSRLWTGQIHGRALDLAVSDGNLLVSTDRGRIHCFGRAAPAASMSLAEPAQAASAPRSPGPTLDLYAKAAEVIVGLKPDDQGYALVLGCENGRLASELAQRTRLKVVMLESDPERIERTRRGLDQAGLYGGRVVVHQGGLDALPYPRHLFNLIVSERTIASGDLPSFAEVSRVLRPHGLACLGQPGGAAARLTADSLTQWAQPVAGIHSQIVSDASGSWAILRCGVVAGGGEWTHQYANSGNTTCSEDTVVGGQLQLQWFGEPGPYPMHDRHSLAPGPVSAGGRLFTLGEKMLFGQDAYNGTLLWTAKLPNLETRVNTPRDCGFMAATKDHVYVAVGNRCLRFSGATGERTLIALPAAPGSENRAGGYKLGVLDVKKHGYALPAAGTHAWGYVGLVGDLLLGSGVPPGTFHDDGHGPFYDDTGAGTPAHSSKVVSHFLFALSQHDSSLKWTYPGLIVNSTIAAGGGRVYFVESRDPQLLQEPVRRPDETNAWKEVFAVALDAATGRKLWEYPLQNEGRTVVFFLCYKDEVVTVLRSIKSYSLLALDAAEGGLLWSKNQRWPSSDHGGHRRHPLIIGDAIFLEPEAYDLRTGAEKWRLSRGGKGCGTLSASSSILFGRSGYPTLFDLKERGQAKAVVRVTRPGCWINMIPSGGLLLMPEAGSGCSCEYALSASMAFAPIP